MIACMAAMAKPGPPARMVITDSAFGTAPRVAGMPLAGFVYVTIVDRYDNPVEDITVTWEAAGDSGSVSPISSVTDKEGRARTQWTLGSAVPLQAIRVGADGVGSFRLTVGVVPP